MRAYHILSEHTVLEVTGDDTRDWLNGQITNDVRTTESGQAVYALFVSRKGRIEADVHAVDRGGDTFWLVVPKASVEALESRFEEQIIMEDVEVEPLENLHVLVLTSDGPSEFPPYESSYGSARIFAGDQDWLVPSEELAPTEALLKEQGYSRLDDQGYKQLRLEQGAIEFDPDLSSGVYPQEAGLRERAVSFNKGCYLGQEVVCMLDTRGKLSRRLVRFTAAGAVEENAPVLAADRAVGKTTSVSQSDDGSVGLAYVKASALDEKGPLSIGDVAIEVTGMVGQPGG